MSQQYLYNFCNLQIVKQYLLSRESLLSGSTNNKMNKRRTLYGEWWPRGSRTIWWMIPGWSISDVPGRVWLSRTSGEVCLSIFGTRDPDVSEHPRWLLSPDWLLRGILRNNYIMCIYYTIMCVIIWPPKWLTGERSWITRGSCIFNLNTLFNEVLMEH